MGWLQAVLATLLAGLCEACPNDRPDIQCFRGAGIEGALLPGPTQNNKWVSATLEVRTDVVIRDLNLLLSVDHAANSDLIIKLQSPSGVTQTLAERSLRGSDLVQFILDDEAAKNFTVEGVAPYVLLIRDTFGQQRARFRPGTARMPEGCGNSTSLTIIANAAVITAAAAFALQPQQLQRWNSGSYT